MNVKVKVSMSAWGIEVKLHFLVKPIYKTLDVFLEPVFTLSHCSRRHELEVNY